MWLTGSCLDLLPTIPDETIDSVVTSPPYFNLRDYQTGRWEGGDASCDHKMPRSTNRHRPGDKSTTNAGSDPAIWNICGKCGAERIDQQIGLEDTPNAYITKMVEVFREIRRVLKPTGTVWLNISDTYANTPSDGIKPKDLMMIPARLALALQADGWWIRQDIIWHKNSAMPESVKDRCTSSYEHVFLLAKNDRYFFDADAIAEPSKYPDDNRKARSNPTQRRHPTDKIAGIRQGSATYPMKNARNVWQMPDYEHVLMLSKSPKYYYDQMAIAEPAIYAKQHARKKTSWGKKKIGINKDNIAKYQQFGLENNKTCLEGGMKNARNVWTINPKPFKGAHFAVMPLELAERCIKAGTSEKGCCPQCGKPWQRLQRRTSNDGRSVIVPANNRYARDADGNHLSEDHRIDHGNRAAFTCAYVLDKEEIGWQPTCKCDAGDPIPAKVLDPFAGAGTTAYAALRLGRDHVSIELNPDYGKLAEQRLLIVHCVT